MLISQVKRIYGSSAKILAQPHLLKNDWYHNNILESATGMVVQGKGHYQYGGQYASGACYWIPPGRPIATHVLATGPDPCQNKYGDEFPAWHIISCDDLDSVITTTSYSSRDEALSEGESMAKQLGVEFVNDAGYA